MLKIVHKAQSIIYKVSWRVGLSGPVQRLTILLLRLVGRDVVKTGRCRCCGSCCSGINLRAGRVWLRSKETFALLQRRNPEYERFVVCGSDDKGYLRFKCSWLTVDGACGNYQNRLEVCRSFPSKSLILCGGELPPGCGYSISAAVPFVTHLENARKKNGDKMGAHC